MINLRRKKLEEETKGFAQYYYSAVYHGDATKEDFVKTWKTVEYLLECGFSAYYVTKNILNRCNTPAITVDNLPDILWKDSLIKRGAFYLHKELRIVSDAPEYNPLTGEIKTYPFFCEMKIRYTEDDLLDYFYNNIGRFNSVLADRNSDKKTIKYLMKKYEKLDFVEPLDVILCLIDNRIRAGEEDLTRLIYIVDNAHDTIMRLQNDMQELASKDLKRTIWRWENV